MGLDRFSKDVQSSDDFFDLMLETVKYNTIAYEDYLERK